uniref:Uncharacterized protein n=1 Tax=Romanomermis culicivorax TaxID=13658 RepID=A0A915L0K4_ROMCU
MKNLRPTCAVIVNKTANQTEEFATKRRFFQTEPGQTGTIFIDDRFDFEKFGQVVDDREAKDPKNGRAGAFSTAHPLPALVVHDGYITFYGDGYCDAPYNGTLSVDSATYSTAYKATALTNTQMSNRAKAVKKRLLADRIDGLVNTHTVKKLATMPKTATDEPQTAVK